MKVPVTVESLTKGKILEQRVPIVRKRKKMRPKGWHTDLRRKRKAGRRAKKGKR